MSENLYRPPESLPSATQVLSFPGGTFDLGKAWSLGWKAYVDQFWLMVAIGLGWLVFYTMATNSCFGIAVVPHLTAGLTAVGLALARSKLKFESVFEGFPQFGSILIVGLIQLGFLILATLVVYIPLFSIAALAGEESSPESFSNKYSEAIPVLISIGVIVCIFLGAGYFYVMGRLHLAYALVLDKKYEPGDALKTSWELTKPFGMSLALMKFVTEFVLPIVGIILCCVPFIFTFPFAIAIQGIATAMLLGDNLDQGLSPDSSGGNPFASASTASDSSQPSSTSAESPGSIFPPRLGPTNDKPNENDPYR